jgi:hypothetical protein
LVSPIKRTVRTSSASTRLKDAEHTALVANAGGRLTQAPRRIGSHSLGEFPLDVVRNDCQRCGRAGSYRLAGLIERFGADAALPDVLFTTWCT